MSATSPDEVLFEYAVLYVPTETQRKNGHKPRVLVAPKHVLATNQQSATVFAAREIPEEFLDRLDQIKVAVRPF